MRAINDCLRLISGYALQGELIDAPVRVLNWTKKAYAQLVTMPWVLWGKVVSTKELKNFKGSSEGSLAVALKAHLAAWVYHRDKNAELKFEKNKHDFAADPDDPHVLQRIDLHVDGLGRFEIESMSGSGPMETFYQRKIFARIQASAGENFWLLVPNETILWAGPFLADLAHHMGDEGSVILPSADGQVLKIEKRPLMAQSIEVFDPTPTSRSDSIDTEREEHGDHPERHGRLQRCTKADRRTDHLD